MTSALPPLLLGDRELPLAELSAARLDGELMAVGHGFVPVDEPVDARHRAAALANDVPPGCTVVGRSAAWLHGASARCPLPVEIGTAGPAGRIERPYRAVRTMRIREEHRWRVGCGGVDVAVLSPVATVIDLARVAERAGDAALIEALIRRCGLSRASVVDALRAWTRLPGKSDAGARIDDAFDAVARRRAVSPR